MIASWDRDSGSLPLVFYLFPSFLSFNLLDVNIENLNRILKLGIYINNELLYRGIKKWDHCCYSSLNLSIFFCFLLLFFSFICLFRVKFVSQFSRELCKLQSSNMAYIRKMSNCIVGLLLFFHFSLFFFFSMILHVSIENLCHGQS